MSHPTRERRSSAGPTEGNNSSVEASWASCDTCSSLLSAMDGISIASTLKLSSPSTRRCRDCTRRTSSATSDLREPRNARWHCLLEEIYNDHTHNVGTCQVMREMMACLATFSARKINAESLSESITKITAIYREAQLVHANIQLHQTASQLNRIAPY